MGKQHPFLCAVAVADLKEIGMLLVRCAAGMSHHADESVLHLAAEQA